MTTRRTSAQDHQGAYSASKAAILALTRAAVLELAPHGIRVNSISRAASRPR